MSKWNFLFSAPETRQKLYWNLLVASKMLYTYFCVGENTRTCIIQSCYFVSEIDESLWQFSLNSLLTKVSQKLTKRPLIIGFERPAPAATTLPKIKRRRSKEEEKRNWKRFAPKNRQKCLPVGERWHFLIFFVPPLKVVKGVFQTNPISIKFSLDPETSIWKINEKETAAKFYLYGGKRTIAQPMAVVQRSFAVTDKVSCSAKNGTDIYMYKTLYVSLSTSH